MKKTEITSLLIPKAATPKLNKEIEKLNRRAKKLDLDPLEAVFGETQIKESFDPNGNKYKYEAINVTIEGSVPSIDGWSVVLVIDHHAEGNIIADLSGGSVTLPKSYREADSRNCDHCGHRRVRNKSFIITDGNDDWMQIGSSCIKDFGDPTVERTLGFLASANRIFHDFENEDYGLGGGYAAWGSSLEEVLDTAILLINAIGFVKSRDENGDYNGDSTKNAIIGYLFDHKARRNYIRAIEENGTIPSDGEGSLNDIRESIIDWIESDNSDSDFMANLKVIFKMKDFVEAKYFGYIAGAVVGFNRKIAREREERVEYNNEFFPAEPKERIKIKGVTLESIKAIESFYGTSFLHRFIDAENRVLVWFASNNKLSERVSETFDIKATIKSHDEYKGLRQTKVNRVTAI